MAIYRMSNSVQNYDWGSSSAIPELTGTPVDPATPVAELWMGAHPKAPSSVSIDGRERSLLDLIRERPEEMLGRHVYSSYGAELPFLFKILAAERALSIQSHPNRKQAEEGYDREEAAGIPIDSPERNYRDRNHKPELICAVTPFWGMRGFRPLPAAAADLRSMDTGTSRALANLLEQADEAEALRSLIERLLSLRGEEKSALLSAATAYAEREWARHRAAGVPDPLAELAGDKGIAADVVKSEAPDRAGAGRRTQRDPAHAPERFFWMLEIARDYPDDIGVMGPLYLNTVRLAPGEAMYLSAGVLHAYLRGTGIELMANSDNVLRGGCTSKQIDVTELLRTTRFVHETPEVLLPGGGEPGFYRSGAREFRLSVCDLDQEGSQASDGGLELPVSGPLVLLLLTGAAEVFDRDSSAAGSDAGFALSAGHSCFVTGTTAAVTVRGRGRLYIAGVMEGRA